ncbi:M20/M25/M40 family metallo-hydrolase, partial [Lysinibacillus capsici]|uniref:M20/M25/M40 family metallo-hydrolase n=1 Tax=Lysinibacillus capsici TaxID=2115968 RepID=UPI002A8109E3
MNNIKRIIAELNSELVTIRQKLHSEPELSWEEYETTNYVAAYLENLGIPYRRTEPTGIIAELKGGREGKTIALRADMDALSVYEIREDIPYRSKTDGKMHACGHDGHTAMLL